MSEIERHLHEANAIHEEREALMLRLAHLRASAAHVEERLRDLALRDVGLRVGDRVRVPGGGEGGTVGEVSVVGAAWIIDHTVWIEVRRGHDEKPWFTGTWERV